MSTSKPPDKHSIVIGKSRNLPVDEAIRDAIGQIDRRSDPNAPFAAEVTRISVQLGGVVGPMLLVEVPASSTGASFPQGDQPQGN